MESKRLGGVAAHLPENIIPALLLKHKLMFRVERILSHRLQISAGLILCAQFSERSVHVVLVDHDTRFRAAGFGAQFGAEAIEVKFPVLEVGVGLELIPAERWLLVCKRERVD